MKKFLFLALASILMISSCTNKPQPQVASHEVQWSDGRNDSVVYVSQPNQAGGMDNFFMNYLLFRTLMGNGGYTNVHNYYQTHPSEFRNQTMYRNYSVDNAPHKIKTVQKEYTSPNRTTTSTTESSKSIFSKAKSSYTSPSRSSSSSSYSSPSRSSSSSYSSPSRSSSSSYSRSSSYSSPSRSSSYSSPSRSSSHSYSSPSRR